MAAVVIALARELGTTYVLMGTPAPPRGLNRLSGSISGRSLLARLLRGLPGVDVRLVADPSLRGAAGEAEKTRPTGQVDEVSAGERPGRSMGRRLRTACAGSRVSAS